LTVASQVMPLGLTILAGATVLLLVTFASPLDGNVLGFCPISEGPKVIGVDGIAALLDASALWLLYRGCARNGPSLCNRCCSE
jgi:hypothetical protein